MKRLIEKLKAFRIYAVICRFFDFQIHFASIYLNNSSAIGFQILTFENCDNDRSLLAIMYDTFGARLFINVLWFQIRLQL
jgi:hypothetical protein